MSLNEIINEIIEYQHYRGETDTDFIEYYFKIHHPIYNIYYKRYE